MTGCVEEVLRVYSDALYDWESLFKGVTCHSMDAQEYALPILRHLHAKFELSEEDVRDYEGRALRGCAAFGRLDVLQYLVREFNFTDRKMVLDALQQGARHGHPRVVEYLLDRFNLTADDAQDALRCAVEHDRQEVIHGLVGRFQFRVVPCQLPSKYVAPPTAEVILQDLCRLSSRGSKVEREHLAGLLRRSALSVAPTTSEQRRAYRHVLYESAADGQLAVVGALVEHFHLPAEDARADGRYAMRAGARCGHLDVVQYLVQHLGLTPQDVREDNDAALWGAVSNGHGRVVKYLVELVDLSAADARRHGRHAFQEAARGARCSGPRFAGCPEVVDYLVERFGWLDAGYPPKLPDVLRGLQRKLGARATDV